MTLWLDDVRPPWKFGYVGATWAKTAEEAIALLKEHGKKITLISLDHDLAPEHYCPPDRLKTPLTGGGTGYDVAVFIAGMGWWPRDGVFVHSMNPPGRKRMMQALLEAADEHSGILRERVAIL